MTKVELNFWFMGDPYPAVCAGDAEPYEGIADLDTFLQCVRELHALVDSQSQLKLIPLNAAILGRTASAVSLLA